MPDHHRLITRIGSMPLPNPVICGSGEPVMTEAGIRAALAAGAAGVIAKSVNERPEAARQLDLADYTTLHVQGARSLFNRSGLIDRDTADWFRAIAAIPLPRFVDSASSSPRSFRKTGSVAMISSADRPE